MGRMIYVDQGSLKTTSFEKMNWYRAIMGNEDMLKINVSCKGFDIGSIDLKINKNKTLG